METKLNNTKKTITPKSKTLITDLVVGAGRGEQVNGAGARKAHAITGDTSQPRSVSRYVCDYLININSKPVSLDDWSDSENLRLTRGNYTLTCCLSVDLRVPKTKIFQQAGVAFLIGQDLMRARIRASDYKNFKCLYAKRIPEMKWLFENTILGNPEFWDMAAQAPGLPIRFTLDHVAYSKRIRAQLPDPNIKPYNVLGTYQWSLAEYEKHKDNKVPPIKTKEDYKDVLNY